MYAAWPFWPRRLLLFLQGPPAFVPSFLASQNGGGEQEEMATGARTGGEPRELIGTKAPGGTQILGMVLARFPGEDHQQSSSDEVDHE